ncbi:pyrroloquinoline quinone biosynthesis protein PqqB [Lampropedia cohaerens]|uniref:Coenzyme PQQ synthesis protein B n=1 Tax=Lampropedia cohaerens TaxID=1610491 RepID=A0A0U1PY20_9BURK|nr:pyrroloquinoline quinone biosynthesis protein PqqB [Lampropedia cohaerens]
MAPPQWNCHCDNCRAARAGDPRITPRTQSSIAVSSDGADWLLVNASPDVLQQLRHNAMLTRCDSLRGSAITAILLMDAQIDHVVGLFMLRESHQRLVIPATTSVLEDLRTALPILPTLEHYCGVAVKPIEDFDTPFAIDTLAGLQLQALPLSSKAPPYSPKRSRPTPGDNIGVRFIDAASGRSLFYAPGLGQIDPQVLQAMQDADVLLVDGRLWSEQEMQTLGLGRKTASEMGHLPLSGPEGMLEVLARFPHKRRILTHINNSNPALCDGSAERQALEAAGIELAFDGMEIEL